MTPLPKITPEQALAVLLKDAKLQKAPHSRSPLPYEAVIAIGSDNHAIVAIHADDLEALEKLTEPADNVLDISEEFIREQSDRSLKAMQELGGALNQAPRDNVVVINAEQEKTRLAFKELHLEMLDTLREMVEDDSVDRMAVALQLDDNAGIYTNFSGGFSATLAGALMHLQNRILGADD